MPGLVVSSDSGFAVIRMACKCRVVMANAVRPSVSKEIASTTPQVRLVAGSHLGFAENLFKLRNDKIRIVIANAVRRSVSKEIASVVSLHRNDKRCAASVGLSWRTQCGDLLATCKEIASPCWGSQ
jgi:hypothetical protein